MALIKCTECNAAISDKAAACPHCGCPVQQPEETLTCPECGGAVLVSANSCSHCGCPQEHIHDSSVRQPVTTRTSPGDASHDQRKVWLTMLSERWNGVIFVPTFLVAGILLMLLASSINIVGWWLVLAFIAAMFIAGGLMTWWEGRRRTRFARMYEGRDDLLEQEATKGGPHALADWVMPVAGGLGFVLLVLMAIGISTGHRISVEPNDGVVIPVKSNGDARQSIWIEFKPRSGMIPTIFIVESELDAEELRRGVRQWRNNPDEYRGDPLSGISFVRGDLGAGGAERLAPIPLIEKRLLTGEDLLGEVRRLSEGMSDDVADMVSRVERAREEAAARGATFDSGRIDLERPLDEFYLVVFNVSSGPGGEIRTPEGALDGSLRVRQRRQ